MQTYVYVYTYARARVCVCRRRSGESEAIGTHREGPAPRARGDENKMDFSRAQSSSPSLFSDLAARVRVNSLAKVFFFTVQSKRERERWKFEVAKVERVYSE